ncbi:dUTP diphosphatase [Aquipuribacter nitratireducens]|uniref:Deoxyuridine 5'-triphosphate nucleotidohydrolase n=1 Tax=Aquipuribacter nitratireducens TaxID=650104 RepID=A0ABW0GJR0_9MICO
MPGDRSDQRHEVVVLVRRDAGVPLPARARPGDAGLDLVTTEDVVLAPGRRATVGTGVALALPDGAAAFVLPRSGLAARHGVTVLNAPGTVDAGYRGEVRVTLHNTDPDDTVELRAGERVAQLVVVDLPGVRLVEVDRLPGSARGDGGFGSTGRGPLEPAGPAHPAADRTRTRGDT